MKILSFISIMVNRQVCVIDKPMGKNGSIWEKILLRSVDKSKFLGSISD